MGRLRVLVVAAAAVAATLLVQPASAEDPPGAVLLQLAQEPGARAELRRLAQQPPATAKGLAVRRAAIADLAPGRAHRDAVVSWAADRGLQVLRDDAWSVTVGGPVADLARAFGSPPRKAFADSVLRVPSALARHVRLAHGLDDAPVMQPKAVPFGLTGPAMRSRYAVPLVGWTGSGITVGTINLTGWDPADLTGYAAAAGLSVSPGQITTVPVSNPPDPLVPDGSGDDLEVAMDAEAILATAPAAKQRMYFAPNNGVGTIDAYNQMAEDGEAGLLQVASTSWGLCEPKAPAWYRDAIGQAVDRMLAAGVTLYAASGDAGRYGCSRPSAVDNSSAVDFPASYPGVVAVGGTRAGLTETAWGYVAADPGTTYAGNGSGGGASGAYPRPAWQSSLGQPGTARLVPDVASVADPGTGMGILNRGQWWLGGGTSLGAPTWAGFTAAALSGAGRTTGLGSIHARLYDNPQAFRDITSGSNGYPATAGYDLVTGLGAPVWTSLAPALVQAPVTPDTVAPTAKAAAALLTGTDARVRLTWSGTDAAPSSGLSSYQVSVTQVGGAKVWQATTGATKQVLTLTPGRSYVLTVRATDLAGNTSAAATARVSVPRDDAALARTGSWTRVPWAPDFKGSHLVSRTKGSALALSFTGRSLTVGFAKATSGGYVDVWVDGRRTMRVDTWAPSTRARQQVRVGTWSSTAKHTVRLVVTGTHRAGATGSWVRVDSATVSPW